MASSTSDAKSAGNVQILKQRRLDHGTGRLCWGEGVNLAIRPNRNKVANFSEGCQSSDSQSRQSGEFLRWKNNQRKFKKLFKETNIKMQDKPKYFTIPVYGEQKV